MASATKIFPTRKSRSDPCHGPKIWSCHRSNTGSIRSSSRVKVVSSYTECRGRVGSESHGTQLTWLKGLGVIGQVLRTAHHLARRPSPSNKHHGSVCTSTGIIPKEDVDETKLPRENNHGPGSVPGGGGIFPPSRTYCQ